MILIALRLLQDTPSSGASSRKVSYVWSNLTYRQISLAYSSKQDLLGLFRHLIGTPQRRVLLPQIDKLLDEQVLLGSSVSSQEMVRSVNTFFDVDDTRSLIRFLLDFFLSAAWLI